MTAKILFVTAGGIEDTHYGGVKGSIRNYLALKKYGEVIVYHIQKRSTLRSFLSLLQGYYPPIDKTDKRNLLKIKEQGVDAVFWDGSIYGNLIDIFADKKNIVFFHNCEYDYVNVRFVKRQRLRRLVYRIAIYNNERPITQKADCLIALSNRDKGRILGLYEVDAGKIQIIPLGIEDKYQPIEPTKTDEPICLLLGALGAANTEGYQWFVDNVSPCINCKTVVAGKGYEKFREQWESEKVKVEGFVENLGEIYEKASFVAIPLWSGGGMKVKTVEAFMHGKTVFGTDEAFSGFDIDLQGVGVLCNSKAEFVDKINSYLAENNDRFNRKAREVYLANYSVQSTEKSFDQVMQTINLLE